jgi:hypothetical protein
VVVRPASLPTVHYALITPMADFSWDNLLGKVVDASLNIGQKVAIDQLTDTDTKAVTQGFVDRNQMNGSGAPNAALYSAQTPSSLMEQAFGKAFGGASTNTASPAPNNTLLYVAGGIVALLVIVIVLRR